ncbi:MAG: hypothetical protein WCT54_05120 [Patescibacteria group bacterium]|jgi:hypothetical protein
MHVKKSDQLKVLQEIENAIVKEELAVPIYSSHIKVAMFWSGLPQAKQDKIVAGLEILLSESINHVRMLRRVKRIYKRLTLN